MTALHFLFVRAINTGSRRLTNDELRAPLVTAGFTDVTAFQAAGNIAFRSPDAAVDEQQIERMLTDAYGFDAPVFVRTAAEARAIVASQPFTNEQIRATAGKIQVTFLRCAADQQRIGDVEAITPGPDLVEFRGSEWFWLPVDGVSSSKLPVPAIEKIVGPMTMRTLGTLARMLEQFAD